SAGAGHVVAQAPERTPGVVGQKRLPVSSVERYFFGRDGRISTLLGRLRPGWRSRSVTTSAMSSGVSFQASSLSTGCENSIATHPRLTTLTPLLRYRTP